MTQEVCIMKTPPLWSTVRVNTLKIDVNTAKERMERILCDQYQTRRPTRPYPTVQIHPGLFDLLLVRGTGPHHVEPLEKEIYVDTDCGCAVTRGADIYVPGILASNEHFSIGDLVSIYMVFDICKRGMKRSYNGKRSFLGNGIAQVSRNQVFRHIENETSSIHNYLTCGIGISITQPIWDNPRLDGSLVEDWGFVQNLPSVVCGHVLDPQSGDVILDMCAAPGGKSTHIATLMKDQGKLICIDSSSNRIDQLLENAKTLSLRSIQTYKMNALDLLHTENLTKDLPVFEISSFDRILLDAPCSCTGQRPFVKQLTDKQKRSHVPLVRKLLKLAFKLLKPGGTMVYSTCSLEMEENEKQVQWFLREYQDIKLVPQSPLLGQEVQVPGGNVQVFDPRHLCKKHQDHDCLQSNDIIDPFDNEIIDLNYDQDTIGFFIAKFMKTN